MTYRVRSVRCVLLAALLAGVVCGFQQEACSAEATEQQFLVDKARITFQSFVVDKGMPMFQQNLKDAKGILIIPELLKGGFILGGSGGSGVLLVKDEEKGDWSPPAFYTLGSLTLGLQIGGEISEVIILITTKKGLDSLYRTSFKLGGDASAAAGPVGKSGKVDLFSDFIAHGRSQGAYAGVNLEGAVITVRDGWNRNYYGRDIRPVEILMHRAVTQPGAEELRMELKKAVP